MPRVRRLAVWMIALGFAGLADVRADEPDKKAADPVAAALGREIIGPRQTLAEIKEYCSGMVPRMPEVKTRAEWEEFAERTRQDVFRRVIFRGEAAAWRDAKTRVEWLDVIEGGPGYKIKKLRFEAVPGLWIPALLYEPDTLGDKVASVLNVNGHDAEGKSVDYKQMRCINQAKRGIRALNLEWFGMGQFRTDDFRHDQINHIDLCGAGGIATHYLAMTRGIDLLLSLDHADPTRVAVTGLSGGGWQTIFVSAFDTRVTLTNPVAGYSSFRTRAGYFMDLGDSEQTPCDLASVTDYAVMTALMAPRATLLTFNAKDQCCFTADHALPPLLDAAEPIFKLFGKEDRLRSHINYDPGTHNYLVDNRQAFYKMVGDNFFAGDAGYNPKEIPSEGEVKTKDQLNVPLPDDNVSLNGLALALSKSLPRDGALPTGKDAARSWVENRRAKLREVIKPKRVDAVVRESSDIKEGQPGKSWRLEVGGWSVPVVELTPKEGEPKGTTLLLCDAGRKDKAAVALAQKLLDGGHRVLAVEPFYVGEAKVAEKDYLFALLLACVGDRPLGLQATEIAAAARWAKGQFGSPVAIAASGPRTSVMALAAAAVEPEAIGDLELRGSHGSLKELIETKAAYTASPELFCFGLLEAFDVAQLAALAAPRRVAFVEPSDRAKKELAGLKGWYATWGVDFDPVR